MTDFTQVGSTNTAIPMAMMKIVKGEENGTETAQKLKQDKELVQFASAPPSECLGQWETHVTGRRMERIPECRKKDVATVAWALKDPVIAKLNDDSYLEYVQTMVSADKQWMALLKDQRRRNPEIPQYFHYVVAYFAQVIGNAEKTMDYALSKKLREVILEEFYILFLIGFHVLASTSSGGFAA